MKTSIALKRLSKATALAAISVSTVIISKVEAAIIRVDPTTLTGPGLITFDEVNIPPVDVPLPGKNFDSVLFAEDFSDPTVGVRFAQGFAGQTLSYVPDPINGPFDKMLGNPSGELKLEAGPADENLVVWANSQVLSGLGPLKYPNVNAIGEGAIAILFGLDQTEFGVYLGDLGPGGSFTLKFFGRDSTQLGSFTLDSNDPSYVDGFYGFISTGGQGIAGVSIENLDPEGIYIDNIIYNNPGEPQNVPEAPSVLGLLAIGVLGAGVKLKDKLK